MFFRMLGRPVGLTSEIRRGWLRPFSGTQVSYSEYQQ